MPELLRFSRDDLPRHLRLQILSFLRLEWPRGFTGENQFRDWISRPEEHARHYVVVENELLISHAEVLWKYLNHGGVKFKTSGLSGILTYPGFRRLGYAHQVVAAAMREILEGDSDIAMLWCRSELETFYSRHGWQGLTTAVTLMGPKHNPTENEELLMMLFISAKGNANRRLFETKPIYFGLDTW